MAADDFIQSSGKGFNVQCALQTHQRWNMMHATSRLNLIQEPEPLLRERQRYPTLTRRTHNRRRSKSDIGSVRILKLSHHARYGWLSKHCLDWQFQAPTFTDTG